MAGKLPESLVRDYVQRIEKGFNGRDTSAIEEILGEHLVDHSELLGRMDLRQRMSRVQEAFPDARYQVGDLLIEGNAVAWKWSIHGTNTEEILGKPPTGKAVTLRGLSVAVIVKEKVVEHWEFADLQDLIEQLEA
jgi:steroid delta-isomerase-like uncharacterized protein